jgi:hypothetical protein
MSKDCHVLESAECDSDAGCLVLHIRDQKPLRLTATIAALRSLKDAVQTCFVHMTKCPPPADKRT